MIADALGMVRCGQLVNQQLPYQSSPDCQVRWGDLGGRLPPGLILQKKCFARQRKGGVMKNDTFDRRAFLKSAVAGTAAAATAAPTLAADAQQSPPAPAPAATSQGYAHLNPEEA